VGNLLCFWAARELGISHTALAKKLEMSLAGIGFSVERGETIAEKGIRSMAFWILKEHSGSLSLLQVDNFHISPLIRQMFCHETAVTVVGLVLTAQETCPVKQLFRECFLGPSFL
jgi:hypothetical protein